MSAGTDREFRIGIVGLRMGAFMLEKLAAHPRAVVVALCDPATDRIISLGDQYGVPGRYADYETMLDAEHLDGVCVSTPNRLHAPMVETALRRGLHVICEKPFTLNTADATRLLALAREKGVTHAVNFSNRTNPAVHFVQRQIASGVLGRVYQARFAYLQDWLADADFPYSWKMSKAESGSGALGDIGSHVLDLGRLLLGEVRSVSARLVTATRERARPDGSVGIVDVDDVADLQIDFVSGTCGQVSASRVARGYRDYRRVELYGERASLILEIDWGLIRVLRADETSVAQGEGFREVFAYDAREWSSIWGGNTAAWVDAASAGRQMTPSFEDAVRCQEIVDAASVSATERRWVDLQ